MPPARTPLKMEGLRVSQNTIQERLAGLDQQTLHDHQNSAFNAEVSAPTCLSLWLIDRSIFPATTCPSNGRACLFSANYIHATTLFVFLHSISVKLMGNAKRLFTSLTPFFRCFSVGQLRNIHTDWRSGSGCVFCLGSSWPCSLCPTLLAVS